ncbi:MAG: NAD(P) transhydrogenase subunit alpha [Bacilli bacterium]|jgi:NAD(P) transhydrogenase subunit alpha|nr:NAD(P) transhydrogenase subunit alpha [Bacilli bacterium]HHU24875.1 NAD(P) transhydrogenase subunit alpha [Acholeplasmataceae bacterium]
MPQWIYLLLLFIAFSIIGYLIIKQVPSLLHTPLMSGMNALSGITLLGALLITDLLARNGQIFLSYVFGGLSVILAMINVVGGFFVTERMLKKFKKGDNK